MMRSCLWFVISLVFLASCKVSSVAPTATNRKEISLWATYYYVPTLAHDEDGMPLLDMEEQELPLRLRKPDWCNAAIQGSVYIVKNDTVFLASYAGRSKYKQFDCRECEGYRNYPGYDLTGKVRWSISDGKVTGSTGLNLVELKSLAVDPKVIPYKSVVFIPAAIGTTYYNENGELVQHDGYFLAADTGSMIKGQHIDVYLGTGKTNPFAFVKSDQSQPFQAFIVKDDKVRERLLEMHR